MIGTLLAINFALLSFAPHHAPAEDSLCVSYTPTHVITWLQSPDIPCHNEENTAP